jgi:hypothetical protein
MDGLSAYGNSNLASAAQYSFSVMNMSMRSKVMNDKGLLEMLPDQQAQQRIQVRGPQPGDTPAIPKGSYFDTYA